MIRRTLTWLSVGLALGLAGAMWFGPSFIQWWWKTPGATTGFSCEPQIASATEWLVKLQLGVGVAAGLLFAIIANLFAGRREKNAATTNPSAAAAPQ